MIRNNFVRLNSAEDLLVEIQAFCIDFMAIKEVSLLYQMIMARQG